MALPAELTALAAALLAQAKTVLYVALAGQAAGLHRRGRYRARNLGGPPFSSCKKWGWKW